MKKERRGGLPGNGGSINLRQGQSGVWGGKKKMRGGAQNLSGASNVNRGRRRKLSVRGKRKRDSQGLKGVGGRRVETLIQEGERRKQPREGGGHSQVE